MFAVLHRLDPSFEEVARDQGASSWQTLRHVVIPMVAPGLVGVALFGFTLSYDEFARTSMVSGAYNTLPAELVAVTTNNASPALYAVGARRTVPSSGGLTCQGERAREVLQDGEKKRARRRGYAISGEGCHCHR
jgi:putative spermidine/putrescine transport system permease protein